MKKEPLHFQNLLHSLEAQGKDVDILFQMRELGEQHVPFEIEKQIWSAIAAGRPDTLREFLLHTDQSMESNDYRTGLLSTDPRRNCQYIAVTSVAVSCRTAMNAGVPEALAYALSDSFIQQIDVMTDPERIMHEAIFIQIRFAELVAKYKQHTQYSKAVRIAIGYIAKHLHEPITAEVIAAGTPYSPKYLAIVFKKETGQTLTRFILIQRIEEAKQLLSQNRTCKEVAYLLGFCSQSHFIQRFKQVTGYTPQQYMNR